MKKFPYRILTEWSDDDACYVARVPAFPNLAAHGDTAGDAATEAQLAAEGMIAVLGDRAPAPDPRASSGNTRLRLPPYLHAALSRLATVEGVSLNQLMVTMLAEQVGARRVVAARSTRTGKSLGVKILKVGMATTMKEAVDRIKGKKRQEAPPQAKAQSGKRFRRVAVVE